MDEREKHEHLIQLLQRARHPDGVPAPEIREELLRRLVRDAVPEMRASEALRERIRTLAAAPPLRRAWSPRWTDRMRWAVVTGLAAAGAIGLSIRPAWVSAQVLRRIDQAILDVRSAHEVTWRLTPGGKRVKEREVWYQAGRWRLESPGRHQIQLFAQGRSWSYDESEKRVTVWRAEGPTGYRSTGFSLAALSHDLAAWGWHNRVSFLSSLTRAGRQVRPVVIERGSEPTRVLLLVDVATDLPIQAETQQEQNGVWVTTSVTDCAFNAPLPEQLFRPLFPGAVRVFDQDAGRSRWELRLAKPIASRKLGTRTIAIRDLEVNAAGAVFLLYTAGRYPGDNGQDWTIQLTDDLETHYRYGGLFQPFMEGNRTPAGQGYVFGGEKLEGVWWMPRTSQQPWKGRRFTLTFQGAARPHHGSDLTEPPSRENAATTTFTLAVNKPAVTLLPGYMPYMAAPVDERALVAGHAPPSRSP